MSGNMNLTLKVWRQANASDKGGFVTYEAKNISPDMSFLEMLELRKVPTRFTSITIAEKEFAECARYTSTADRMVQNGQLRRASYTCAAFMMVRQSPSNLGERQHFR
jgi:hypothetical protein